MKKWSKLAALVLAAAMLLALCACGNDNSNNNNTTDDNNTPAQDDGNTTPDTNGGSDTPETKTIVFGTSADYAPFEFHVLKDGVDTVVGIDVALAQKIADDMGAELVIKDISFDSLCIELSQGTVDFVIAAMEKDEDRDALVDFSDPYYTDVPPQIVTLKDNAASYTSLADFAGKIVGAQTATTKADIVTGEMEGAQPLLLSSVNDLIASLVNGKCDALVLDGAVAEKYVAANEELGLVDIALGEAAIEPYRVAVQEGDPKGLLDSINASIADALANDLVTGWSEEADTLSSEAIGLE